MKGWVQTRRDNSLTLHRPGRARLDVQVPATLAGQHRQTRLAHAIRQDLWRALQTTRGFSPIVQLDPQENETKIIAGGQIDGRSTPALAQAIKAVLENPKNRHRWQQWARK